MQLAYTFHVNILPIALRLQCAKSECIQGDIASIDFNISGHTHAQAQVGSSAPVVLALATAS